MPLRLLTSFALALLLAACGPANNDDNAMNGSTNGGEVPSGEMLYEMPLEGANTFTCSTCHAMTEPAGDGFTRPGHPIGDAYSRDNYKNGQVDELMDAVNSCVVEWMGGTPFTAEDPEWLALEEFLAENAPDDGVEVTYEIVQPPADLSGGDREAGLRVFDTTCAVCHGAGGGGTNKAPPVAGLNLDAEYIGRRVRLSGSPDSPVYDGLTGGRMPFWSADRLSDDELIDIVAYLVDSEMIEPGNNINANPNNTNNTDLRECDSTHSKVGQTMQFETKFHGVSGTAEIVDDCTIEITNFNYDGQGIEVLIYAAEGGNYGSGFSISDDLLRSGGYENESLTVQLPESRSLDEVDGLSVWCVAVGSSFGDGLFQ